MTDKLSQETDDVLSSLDDQEQTLGGMTEDTENQTQNGNGNGKPSKKTGGKGTSKNGIIVVGIAIGLAVVLGVGYFAFIKKSPTPKAKTIKKKDVQENKETPATTVTPMAPVENGFPADNASKESQTAADFLNRDANPIPVLNEVAKEVPPAVEVVNSVAPVVPEAVLTSQLEPVVPVVPVVPEAVLTSQLEPVAPVVPEAVLTSQLEPVVPVVPEAVLTSQLEPVVPVAPVLKPVEPPVTVQDTSINSAFDSMATRVDAVSTRVDGLEKFKSAQEDLNNQIEKRITRLEGFHEGDKACNCDNTEAAKAKPIKKASTSKKTSSGTVAPVRSSTPKPAPKPKAQPKENIDGDVLVDKSSVKNRAAVSKPAPLEQYQFHSIYDNRVWWRKADGSLETATVGGRLPSGEVIKEVNHDKFEVITDKRTIRKH